MTYQVDILNPKADKLLQNLADLKLITLSKTSSDPFMAVVKRLRKKAVEKLEFVTVISKPDHCRDLKDNFFCDDLSRICGR